jgi:hypothetical protein
MNNLENNDGYLCKTKEERLYIMEMCMINDIPINSYVWEDRNYTHEFETYPILVWCNNQIKVNHSYRYCIYNMLDYGEFIRKLGIRLIEPHKLINKHTFI